MQCAPPITQIKNGKVIENGGTAPWEYEDKITVNCEDGYLINGAVSSLTLECNENGTWSERPSCKGKSLCGQKRAYGQNVIRPRISDGRV